MHAYRIIHSSNPFAIKDPASNGDGERMSDLSDAAGPCDAALKIRRCMGVGGSATWSPTPLAPPPPPALSALQQLVFLYGSQVIFPMVSSFYVNYFPAGQEVEPRDPPVVPNGEHHFSSREIGGGT
jgi:hypothetical protein